MGLARSLQEIIKTNPSEGFEHILGYDTRPIPLNIRVEDPEVASRIATSLQQPTGGTNLYTDGSRLNNQRVGAAVVYKVLNGP